MLGHLMTDLNQGMLPALLPFFIAERGLSDAAAGGLVLAANVVSSVVQPAFGSMADRRPSPWPIPGGVAAAGVGMALSGLAPTDPLIAAPAGGAAG
jgi:MFS transporter, FSR family, fosmidomycin resistance protein